MDEYNKAYFRAGAWSRAEENGKIWMALKNRNGICEIDKKTLCGKIIKYFESELLADDDLYSHIEKVGNTLKYIGTRDNFLNRTPTVQTLRSTMNK